MELKHTVVKFLNELGIPFSVNDTTPLPVKVSAAAAVPIEITNETAVPVNIGTIPTINTQAIEDTKATYIVAGIGQANTSAGQSIAICSGAVKQTRVRKIVIVNPGTQTTAGWRTFTIKRMTTAVVVGGGESVTPFRLNDADGGYSGTAWSKATDGTAGTSFTFSLWVPATAENSEPITIWPIAGIDSVKNKDIVIPVGVTHGLAVDDSGASGAAGFSIMMEITEETVA